MDRLIFGAFWAAGRLISLRRPGRHQTLYPPPHPLVERLCPLNYAHFLDYATKLIFLRKVGGGYIFIHRMLLEHFAAMSKNKDGTEVP